MLDTIAITPRVTFCGTFLTGVEVDSELLQVNGYGPFQLKLQSALNRDSTMQWSYQEASQGHLGLRFAGPRHAHAVTLPLALVTASMGPAFLEESLNDISPATFAGVALDFYDFGVGSLRLEVVLPSTDIAGMQGTNAASEELSDRLMPHLNALVRDATRRVELALRAESIGTHHGEAPANGQVASLLWLHKLYVIDVAGADRTEKIPLFRPLLSGFFDQVNTTSLTFLPGVDTSVILREPDSPTEWLETLTSFNFAYYAKLTEMDKDLFSDLTSFMVESRGASSKRLQSETSRVTTAYERLRLFRSSVNTSVTHLGATSVRAWESIGKVARVHQLEASLQDKLDILQQVHRFRTDELQARRAGRLNKVVQVLTALSLVGGLAALIDFAFGTDLLSPNLVRLALAVALLMLGILVFLFAFVERAPRR